MFKVLKSVPLILPIEVAEPSLEETVELKVLRAKRRHRARQVDLSAAELDEAEGRTSDEKKEIIAKDQAESSA